MRSACAVELFLVLERVVTLGCRPQHTDVALLVLLDGHREVLGLARLKRHVLAVTAEIQLGLAHQQPDLVRLVLAVVGDLDRVLGALAHVLAVVLLGARSTGGNEKCRPEEGGDRESLSPASVLHDHSSQLRAYAHSIQPS